MNQLKETTGLLTYEVVIGAIFAGFSGIAVLVHTFGPVPMSFSVPFVVFPTAALLVGIMLFRRRLYGRLHLFSSHLILGAFAGLLATFAYDAVRPLLTWTFGLSFNPYRAMPLFGSLITGLPESAPVAIGTGWLYHFWNGISFGMMFALFKPRGGVWAGFVWAMLLQGLMMLAYPSFLQARLDDPGFLMTGLVGHGLWGVVLGLCLKHPESFRFFKKLGISVSVLCWLVLVPAVPAMAHDCSSLADCLETAGFNGILSIFGGLAGLITWLLSQGLLNGETLIDDEEIDEDDKKKEEEKEEEDNDDADDYDGPCADAMARLDLARAMFNSTMLSANILRSQLTALDKQYEQMRESYYLSGAVDVGFLAGSAWTKSAQAGLSGTRLAGLAAKQIATKTMISKMVESALKGLAKETVKTVTKHLLDQQVKFEDLIKKPLLGSEKGIGGAAKKWIQTEIEKGILQGEISRLGKNLDPNGPVYKALKNGLKSNVAAPLAKAFSDGLSVGSSMISAIEGKQKLEAMRKQISDIRSKLYGLENQIDLDLRPEVELAQDNYKGCLESDLYKDFIKKKKAKQAFMNRPKQG